jgi:nucleotide-binding universal stress UspA family protein
VYPWHRILIPTDFSTAARWAFDDAVRMAASSGAELLILHIRATRAANPSELRFPADDSLYRYAEEQELNALRERVKQSHASVPVHLLVRLAPDPGKEICRTAGAEGVDLIVVSTHARHHVAHLLVGSTTQSILSGPPAPVLAVRYGVKKHTGMRRIVVPVHFDQTLWSAAELASAIAAHEKSEVHIITVCPKNETRDAEEMLRGVAGRWFAGALTRHAVVQSDDVADAVVDYCAENDVDALFINAHAHLAPLAHTMIRKVGAPVMIVP